MAAVGRSCLQQQNHLHFWWTQNRGSARWALPFLVPIPHHTLHTFGAFASNSVVRCSRLLGSGFRSRGMCRALLASEFISDDVNEASQAHVEGQVAAGDGQVKDAVVDKKSASRKCLIGKSLEELQELSVEMGEQKYRGKQMHLLIYKAHKKDIQDFVQLPKQFRDKLVAAGWEVGRSPIHHKTTSIDGTIKVLLRLEDNRLIETVGIPAEERRGSSRLTVCVSSQVGCPLRCAFCATGKGGFARNLKPHEIIEQVLLMEEIFQSRVSNVVFMGMGEPMLNLPSVLTAHRALNEDIGIGQRMITISTVGVPNTIGRLATHNLQSTLAISLHAPNQLLREQIVPSAKAYPLDALLEDCKLYFDTTGRRVSFEYTLLAGVNDRVEHARELGDLLRRWDLSRHVNLIPYNPVADSEFQRPVKKSVEAFVEALERCRVVASVRQTRGLDANAACGQLRNQFQKTPLI